MLSGKILSGLEVCFKLFLKCVNLFYLKSVIRPNPLNLEACLKVKVVLALYSPFYRRKNLQTQTL